MKLAVIEAGISGLTFAAAMQLLSPQFGANVPVSGQKWSGFRGIYQIAPEIGTRAVGSCAYPKGRSGPGAMEWTHH